MANNIVFVSGYSGKHMKPFVESFRSVLIESSKDIGLIPEYIEYSGEDMRFDDSIVIIISIPDMAKKIAKTVHGNNIKKVFWNLEPFYCNDGYGDQVSLKKIVKRTDISEDRSGFPENLGGDFREGEFDDATSMSKSLDFVVKK